MCSTRRANDSWYSTARTPAASSRASSTSARSVVGRESSPACRAWIRTDPPRVVSSSTSKTVIPFAARISVTVPKEKYEKCSR